MTDRQKEVLTFIRGHLRRHGVPPTMDEIAGALGLANRTTPWTHCQALVKQGLLETRLVRGTTAYFPVEKPKSRAA